MTQQQCCQKTKDKIQDYFGRQIAAKVIKPKPIKNKIYRKRWYESEKKRPLSNEEYTLLVQWFYALCPIAVEERKVTKDLLGKPILF